MVELYLMSLDTNFLKIFLFNCFKWYNFKIFVKYFCVYHSNICFLAYDRHRGSFFMSGTDYIWAMMLGWGPLPSSGRGVSCNYQVFCRILSSGWKCTYCGASGGATVDSSCSWSSRGPHPIRKLFHTCHCINLAAGVFICPSYLNFANNISFFFCRSVIRWSALATQTRLMSDR